MYVAYNRFYQTELTQVEKRNASPDRAHNETWDSLAITGLFGLLAYLTVFGSVIYYGLKWLGLVPGDKWRNLFFLLYIFSGVLTAAFFWFWKGVAYLGVALPFGMTLGVILYLILISLTLRLEGFTSSREKLRAYLLLGLVAAVIAHFVEINFGIAIASTRTYFWVSSALILLVGYVLPLHTSQAPENAPESENLSSLSDSADRVETRGQSRKTSRQSIWDTICGALNVQNDSGG
jgi:hypothetical protein